MAHQASIHPDRRRYLASAKTLRLHREWEQPLWRSLYSNLKDTFFPEELPPLRITSRPVAIPDVWSQRKRSATVLSLVLHATLIGGLIAASLMPSRPIVAKPIEHVTPLIAPVLAEYRPAIVPQVAKKVISGGGGGGAHAKLIVHRGHLPKIAQVQIAPPTVEIRNLAPKLVVKPTIVATPNVKIVDDASLPNLGNPAVTRLAAPPSNGGGSGGGIGTGAGGGIGSTTGPGFGPGHGGGFGGGTYKVGELGVSAPVAKYTPEPEFTDEARKAKHQGTVTLAAIIGPDGHPRSIRVVRGLGMGLDEKAVERVKSWQFVPGKKDGQPVAVAITLQVEFRLF